VTKCAEKRHVLIVYIFVIIFFKFKTHSLQV